jgi:DNA-binding CsgD family transcriptional regulator
MVLAVFLPKLLMFFKPFLNQTGNRLDASSIIVAILLIVFAICTYLYRKNGDDIQWDYDNQAPPKAYSLMVLVFIVLMLNDVIAPANLQCLENISQHQKESMYFYGILTGVILVLLLQYWLSVNVCNLINFSFALAAIGYVFSILHNETRNTGLVSAYCFGVSYSVAMVNIYYLAGFMAKKFQSIKFYRIGITLSSIYYFTSILVIETSEKAKFFNSGEFMSLFSLGILILFFLFSPMFMKILNNGEWIDDAYRTDVTSMSRLEAKLKEFKLTPSEIEVCTLLLEGYTLRQISGMLGKAYSTINTYYVSVYKKLNVNSRAELLITFQDYMK